MGPLSFMRSVVDRNVVMRRIPVFREQMEKWDKVPIILHLRSHQACVYNQGMCNCTLNFIKAARQSVILYVIKCPPNFLCNWLTMPLK